MDSSLLRSDVKAHQRAAPANSNGRMQMSNCKMADQAERGAHGISDCSCRLQISGADETADGPSLKAYSPGRCRTVRTSVVRSAVLTGGRVKV